MQEQAQLVRTITGMLDTIFVNMHIRALLTCPTVHTERKELSRAVDQQRMGALTSKLCSMRVLIANLMEVCVHFVTPLHAVDCQHCRKV